MDPNSITSWRILSTSTLNFLGMILTVLEMTYVMRICTFIWAFGVCRYPDGYKNGNIANGFVIHKTKKPKLAERLHFEVTDEVGKSENMAFKYLWLSWAWRPQTELVADTVRSWTMLQHLSPSAGWRRHGGYHLQGVRQGSREERQSLTGRIRTNGDSTG